MSNEDHVVVDVEIQEEVEETEGGWNATDKLGVGVAVLWEDKTQNFRVYGPDDEQRLRDRLLSATRISGFNTFNFDFPVIWRVERVAWTIAATSRQSKDWNEQISPLKAALEARSNDILRRIWIAKSLDPDDFNMASHGGYSLDSVAGTTIGRRKTGHGADAPRLFKEKRWCELIEYCVADVAIERDLVAFVDRYGYIVSERHGVVFLDGRKNKLAEVSEEDKELKRQLLSMESAHLTEWEVGFVTSMAKWVGPLTEKQRDRAKKILGK